MASKIDLDSRLFKISTRRGACAADFAPSPTLPIHRSRLDGGRRLMKCFCGRIFRQRIPYHAMKEPIHSVGMIEELSR